MSDNQSIHAKRLKEVSRGLAEGLPICVDKALNSELWDVEGKRYIDFAGGIGVLNVGHRHPKVIAAAKAQIDQLTHLCFQVADYESYIELCACLNQLAPGSSAKKSILFNSGAEAVENALKIARSVNHRQAVIAFQGGFHGRTLQALSLTSKVNPYKKGLGALPGPVFHAPFPDPYHGVSEADAIAGLEAIFKYEIDPEAVSALMIEPVQGEGGFRVASKTFLQYLRNVCDEYGIVFIDDEVQSGFARTGKLFAIEHSGVEPDIVLSAKSLAGGFPLSAVTGKAEIMDAPSPGGLGGTYAGSPVSCAAALAVLDVIEDENLLARSTAIGKKIHAYLTELSKTDAGRCIGEIRGLGAMMAFEVVSDQEKHTPDAKHLKAIREKALALGLIILSCGCYGNTLRMLMPLTISDEVLDEGLGLLKRALAP